MLNENAKASFHRKSLKIQIAEVALLHLDVKDGTCIITKLQFSQNNNLIQKKNTLPIHPIRYNSN